MTTGASKCSEADYHRTYRNCGWDKCETRAAISSFVETVCPGGGAPRGCSCVRLAEGVMQVLRLTIDLKIVG
jgi:hypothetical protein